MTHTRIVHCNWPVSKHPIDTFCNSCRPEEFAAAAGRYNYFMDHEVKCGLDNPPARERDLCRKKVPSNMSTLSLLASPDVLNTAAVKMFHNFVELQYVLPAKEKLCLVGVE